MVAEKPVTESGKDKRMCKYRFCNVTGNMAQARMLERVYDGLDGGIRNTPWNTHEHLWQHYHPGKRMFECGPSWRLEWDIRTDSPGFFVGLTGWLPFLEPFLRTAYRNTLMNISKKQRKDGCFPLYPVHGQYKTEDGDIAYWGNKHYRTDDYIDGHMCVIINTCEDILFTRDKRYACERLPKLRKAVEMLLKREFKNGLMKVGYGGAFIELWYSYEGYPASSQIYLIRSLTLMSEVEKLLGNQEETEKLLSFIPDVQRALHKHLLTREGYFIGAIDVHGKKHGAGDEYFESIPNVIAAPLEVTGEKIARSICRKITTIPELNSVPMAVNYPGRWEEMNRQMWKRGIGSHWNGGAWMGFGGFEVWTHLIARDYDNAERFINRMMDYRDEYGLQDFVGNFGQSEGVNMYNRQPCDHPIIFQHGSTGNTLRGLLGIQPRHDGIEITPRIFTDIKEIELKKPVYYADKEIYFSIKNGKELKKVMINGISIPIENMVNGRIHFQQEQLPARMCFIRIEYS